MTEAEKAYQYFVIAVPENEEQAKAYFWARKALVKELELAPEWDGHTSGEAIRRIGTLTQPNEPLTCEGCIYEHNEHENCNYCKRAPYLGDYYYRRPPEGEKET